MVGGARRNARALAVLAAVLAVTLAAVALVWKAGRTEHPILARGATIAVKTSFTPGEHLFADVPLARLDVLVNRKLVDPGSVRVDAVFKPYRVIATLPVVRKRLGQDTRLEFRYRLSCLTRACVPKRVRRDFTLPVARVSYSTRAQAARRIEEAAWPVLAVVSRLKPSDLKERKFVDGLDPLPAATYPVSPDLLSGLLLGLAVLLVLGTGGLAAYRLRAPAGAGPVVARQARVLSPLEQALELVERALAGLGVDEQRRALERLGREVASAGRRDLAVAARRLAWSRTGPSAVEARELAENVRRELVAGGALMQPAREEAAVDHVLAGGA